MPRSYCELELRLEWIDRGRYCVTVRLNDPLSDIASVLVEPMEVSFNFDRLLEVSSDAVEYGRMLTKMLFDGDGAGNALTGALQRAQSVSRERDGLRLRLAIQSSAPELHDLRWETLCDPATGTPLSLQDNVWLSRFLTAQEFRFKPFEPGTKPRVLVVVANPSDLKTKWGLEAIDTKGEIERLGNALRIGERDGLGIVCDVLKSPATVYNIVARLRDHYADILYVVCHGTFTVEGDPRLLLENDAGTAHSVKAKELVERMRDMIERPRLVVLASCESAGNQDRGVLSALGPRLAEAGVGAVVAMQGKISMKSASRFFARFFTELARSGQVDYAMAKARGDIRDQADWWMPTLFMRLKTGRLLQTAVFDDEYFEDWDTVITDIDNHQCVPVLGPGLVESMFGATRDIARKWAERYEFPLTPRDRDDLAQVAQFRAYRKTKAVMIQELRAELAMQIRSRYWDDLQQIGESLGRSPHYRSGEHAHEPHRP